MGAVTLLSGSRAKPLKLKIMKQDVFNSYVDKIISKFGITREELFSKSKRRELVDARHILYSVCFHRPMQVMYIQKYMAASGYKIGHSSIIHGIKVSSDRMKLDDDYIHVIREVERCTL